MRSARFLLSTSGFLLFLLSAPLAAAGAGPAPPDNVAAALAAGGEVGLVDAVRYALANAREVRMSAEDARIAELGRVRARAGERPRVDAGANATALSSNPGAVINGNPVATSERRLFTADVTAVQNLYDFGRTRARVAQAEARGETAALAEGVARERQALDVIAAFLSARRAGELLDVAKESLRVAQDHRRVAGELYDQGAVAMNDVLSADVAVANADALLVAAENRLEIARSRLALAMGLSGERSVNPSRGEFPVPLERMPLQSDSLRIALAMRREIRAQEAAIREEEAAVRAAEAEMRPTLFARGGYAYDSNRYNPNTGMFSAVLGGRVNLYAGGADEAALRQALAAVRRRQEGLALLSDTIALDVKAASLSVLEAERRRAAAGKAVAAARENLRIQDDRYREGLATATEQLEAQSLLARAETDLRNGTFDLHEARYRLAFARGELLEFLALRTGG